MQISYTTSEAMGSVSVCVNISSAQLARNVSVTLRSVTAGAALGKPFQSQHKGSLCVQAIQECLVVTGGSGNDNNL